MFNRLLTVFWVVFFQRPCSSEQFFFKNFQGCITVYLSRYIFVVLAFPAATDVILTDVVWLVKHFFNFFKFLFSKLFAVSAAVFILTPFCLFVNTFLFLFLKFLSVNYQLPFQSVKGTEKEGFEPSRRYKRPTPLAGAPLQPLEYFSLILNQSSTNMKMSRPLSVTQK